MLSDLNNELNFLSKSMNFSKLKNKSILVTGGSGLIGGYLLNFFSHLNDQEGLNCKILAISLSGKYLNVAKHSKNVNYLNGDLTKDLFLKSIPKVDFIIHAAGYGQPNKFMGNPLKTLQLNSSITEKLIEKCNENFLFLSSSEIYSGLEGGHYSETQVGTTNTNHPRAAYIEGKRYGECVSLLANRVQKITANVARVSLAYGPGTRYHDERVLSHFIVKALDFSKIEMLDDGQRIRTYAYISDVVLQLLSIIMHGEGDIYNVGGTSKVTILELAQVVANKTGAELVTKAKDNLTDSSPSEVNLSLTKILQITPKFNFLSLDKGVDATIGWFKYLKSSNNFSE